MKSTFGLLAILTFSSVSFAAGNAQDRQHFSADLAPIEYGANGRIACEQLAANLKTMSTDVISISAQCVHKSMLWIVYSQVVIAAAR